MGVLLHLFINLIFTEWNCGVGICFKSLMTLRQASLIRQPKFNQANAMRVYQFGICCFVLFYCRCHFDLTLYLWYLIRLNSAY